MALALICVVLFTKKKHWYHMQGSLLLYRIVSLEKVIYRCISSCVELWGFIPKHIIRGQKLNSYKPNTVYKTTTMHYWTIPADFWLRGRIHPGNSQPFMDESKSILKRVNHNFTLTRCCWKQRKEDYEREEKWGAMFEKSSCCTVSGVICVL